MANFNIDYLVVAGCGGGAGGTTFQTNQNVGGGGAGAGGLLTSTGVSLTIGASYTVLIGNGGAGGPWAGTGNSIAGTSGSDSSITGTGVNALAYGGGGGGSGLQNQLGLTGGSGGGSGFLTTQGGAGTAGQGNNGGYSGGGSLDGSGGGGGAGSIGGNGTYISGGYRYLGGTGGAGLQNSITGVSPAPYYAGGGGGGPIYEPGQGYYGTGGIGGSGVGGGGGNSTNNTSRSGAAGAINTGSGGGGGSRSTSAGTGGAGGSGIVIIRYTTAEVASYTATGITPAEDTTTISGQTILSFTTVGTGAITFTAPVSPPFNVTRVTNPVTGFESPVDIGLKLPSGTNANQPSGTQGMIRNDTSETTGGSTSAIEHYNGTTWKYFAATESAPPVNPSANILYLDANDITSWPTTGSTWYDISGNNHNGAITGASYNSTEKGFQFNGSTSQYVNISNYSLNATKAFSVWIKPNDYSTRFPFSIGDGQAQETFVFLDNTYTTTRIGNAQARFVYNNTTSYYNVIGNVNSSNVVDLWIDGTKVVTGTANPVTVTSQQAYIGARYNGGSFSQGYNGYLSKIQLYDTTLTDLEIAALFAQGKGF